MAQHVRTGAASRTGIGHLLTKLPGLHPVVDELHLCRGVLQLLIGTLGFPRGGARHVRGRADVLDGLISSVGGIDPGEGGKELRSAASVGGAGREVDPDTQVRG